MESRDIARLTKAVPEMYGLVNVVAGLAMAGFFLPDLLMPRSLVRDLVKTLAILVYIPAHFWTRNYYRRRIGWVKQPGGRKVAIFFMLLAPIYVFCSYLDGVQTAVSFMSFFWAGMFLKCFSTFPSVRLHALPLSAMFLIVGLLPLTGVARVDQLFVRGAIGHAAVGLALIMLGVCDHLTLTRMFSKSSADLHNA